ncbi:hypothetical protein [Lacticaseibacillus kribbianus]|uniref:hypothetical protein n=1 Tax=Lacticaseibacillus kribbianus TaxID=2926292 RepID=UPI001CD21F84|nr:hypothetical protein [Lacticaseibacillus kribbianus]
MGIWAWVIGTVLIALGLVQAGLTWHGFRHVQTAGGAETSPFIMGSFGSSVFIAVVLILAGIGTYAFH